MEPTEGGQDWGTVRMSIEPSKKTSCCILTLLCRLIAQHEATEENSLFNQSRCSKGSWPCFSFSGVIKSFKINDSPSHIISRYFCSVNIATPQCVVSYFPTVMCRFPATLLTQACPCILQATSGSTAASSLLTDTHIQSAAHLRSVPVSLVCSV